jgi:hypothetical protein
MRSKKVLVALGLSLSLLLTGCFGGAESSVTASAQKRWDAMIAGDAEQAYSFYTDAFKQTTPYEHFKNKMHGVGLWSGAKVNQVTCEPSGKHCSVVVDVTVSMKMRGLSQPLNTTDRVSETWVKDGWLSDWRYVKQ